MTRTTADQAQCWDLRVDGRSHRVEITGSLSRTSSWYVDDELVGTKKASDERVTLHGEQAVAAVVGLRFDGLGRVRRVTLFEGNDQAAAKAKALIGTDGIDFDPEPGSYAARRAERVRAHPRRHAVIAVAAGVAKVALPLVLGLLAVRFVVQLPWPDWHIPWPDIRLPRIPWPRIPWPDINWPDFPWPDVTLPEWLRWVLDRVNYVWPILLAAVLAKAEIDRQRKQDALKARRREEAAREQQSDRPGPDSSPPTL